MSLVLYMLCPNWYCLRIDWSVTWSRLLLHMVIGHGSFMINVIRSFSIKATWVGRSGKVAGIRNGRVFLMRLRVRWRVCAEGATAACYGRNREAAGDISCTRNRRIGRDGTGPVFCVQFWSRLAGSRCTWRDHTNKLTAWGTFEADSDLSNSLTWASFDNTRGKQLCPFVTVPKNLR